MIYLDNAATTRVYERANRILFESGDKFYFNASALYAEAAEADRRITAARRKLSDILRAGGGEIYFTSGGTESDNTALFGAKKAKGSRIIVSEGEHDAVINPAKQLAQQGYDVVFAPIKPDGGVDEEAFSKLLTPNTSLVSVMHVSNETGAVNDIARLVRMTKSVSPKALFHSDGVQAFGKIKVDLRALGADMYSLSGHKIHAPKGIGALYVASGASVKPLLFGGGQELGFRSGTENTPMIAAFAAAAEESEEKFEENYSKKRGLIEHLAKRYTGIEALSLIPGTVGAAPVQNIGAYGVELKDVVESVEAYNQLTFEKQIYPAEACGYGYRESRFKKLLGLPREFADGIVRFSVSEFNTDEEMVFAAKKAAEAAEKLSAVAPR